jgi:hypothetical protein
MDPWKELGTRNWVPRRQPVAVRPNSGEPLAGAGRARAGIGPWVLGGRFRGLVVEGKGRRGGAPAASGGGRRGLLCQRWGLDAGIQERLVS